MNCIIVSDKLTCILLEEFVLKTSFIKLIGTFDDPGKARDQLLKRHDIDIVIVDPEMIGSDIFNFISRLDYKPNVIMVSSGDEFALKAFDFNIVDYILKPVTYSRFYRSIDKALRYYFHREVTNYGEKEIFIKRGTALIKLKLKYIAYIEALENYVTLFTDNEKYTIHFTMKGIENQLPSGVFIRVHRSFIVNKNRIQAINENTVDINVGDKIKSLSLGKSFREALLNEINLLVR